MILQHLNIEVTLNPENFIGHFRYLNWTHQHQAGDHCSALINRLL